MKYSTIRKIWKQVALILAVAAVLAVAGIRALDDYLDRTAWERTADVIYPMTNQYITWTGGEWRCQGGVIKAEMKNAAAVLGVWME